MIYKTRTIEIDPTNETLLSVDFGRADAIKFIFDFGSFDTSAAVKSRVFAYRDTDAAYCFGAEFTQAGVEIVSSSESASASESASESESLGSEWLAYFSSVRTSGYSGALRMTVQLVDANGDLINSANILCNVVETNATTPFEPSPEFRDEVLDALAAAQAAQTAAETAATTATTQKGLVQTMHDAVVSMYNQISTWYTAIEGYVASALGYKNDAETAATNAGNSAAYAAQSASDAAAYVAGVDSKRLQPVGRYEMTGGSITIKPFIVTSSASYAITLQGFIGTLTKGSIVITSTAGGLSLTDGVNTISATGLSATDALATQFIFTATATKIIVNGTIVATGAWAAVNTYSAITITGTAGFVSRMKVFSFDMSAVGALYTVAQYNAGVNEPPSLHTLSEAIINNATVFPVAPVGTVDRWQTSYVNITSVAYSGNTLVSTQQISSSNYNSGMLYLFSKHIKTGSPYSISISSGTTTCATACGGAMVIAYSDGTELNAVLIGTTETPVGVLPAMTYSGIAQKDIKSIAFCVRNNVKLAGETFTWGDIVIQGTGTVLSLSSEAHVCQIPDETGNQNCAFFTQNVGFDNVRVFCDMADILPFASGATAGFAVGGNSDKKPMRALSYNAVRVRLSPASTLTSAAFKFGTVANSTAYNASTTVTKTWQTILLINDGAANTELIVAPVSALASAGNLQIIILQENVQYKA